MLKIGVLVSGGGTNLQAILDNIENGYITNAQVVTVISSNPEAYALKRAEKYGINGVCIRKKDYSNEEEFLKAMEEQGVKIYSCGTCLDFYDRKDLLKVGEVTNMYTIVELMAKAEKILKP